MNPDNKGGAVFGAFEAASIMNMGMMHLADELEAFLVPKADFN